MERDNLTEQARALNAAVAVIKEYCESRTADDACRKCLFRDNCGGEPYTWGNEPPHPAGRAGKRGGAELRDMRKARRAGPPCEYYRRRGGSRVRRMLRRVLPDRAVPCPDHDEREREKTEG